MDSGLTVGDEELTGAPYLCELLHQARLRLEVPDELLVRDAITISILEVSNEDDDSVNVPIKDTRSMCKGQIGTLSC